MKTIILILSLCPTLLFAQISGGGFSGGGFQLTSVAVGECVPWLTLTNSAEGHNGHNSFALFLRNTNSEPMTICKIGLPIFVEYDTNVHVRVMSGYFSGTQWGSYGHTPTIVGWTPKGWHDATFATPPVVPAGTDFYVCVEGGPSTYVYTSTTNVYEGATYHAFYAAIDDREEDPAIQVWQQQE